MAAAPGAPHRLNTYWRGGVVYSASHDFNRLLERAYAFDPGAAQYERFIYPDLVRARISKAELARMRIGPYAAIATERVDPPARPFVTALALAPGTSVAQRVAAHAGVLIGLELQTVTFLRRPDSYPIRWTLSDVAGPQPCELAAGTLDAHDLRDWHDAQLDLPMTILPADTELELRLSVGADARAAHAAGLPIYRADPPAGLVLAGAPAPDQTLRLITEYVRQ